MIIDINLHLLTNDSRKWFYYTIKNFLTIYLKLYKNTIIRPCYGSFLMYIMKNYYSQLRSLSSHIVYMIHLFYLKYILVCYYYGDTHQLPVYFTTYKLIKTFNKNVKIRRHFQIKKSYENKFITIFTLIKNV